MPTNVVGTVGADGGLVGTEVGSVGIDVGLYVLIPTYTHLYRHGTLYWFRGYFVDLMGSGRNRAAILALKTMELPFWR